MSWYLQSRPPNTPIIRVFGQHIDDIRGFSSTVLQIENIFLSESILDADLDLSLSALLCSWTTDEAETYSGSDFFVQILDNCLLLHCIIM